MGLLCLIEALSEAAAYPHPVERVEVRHTHISVVFLAGPFAYKVKKPVNLGFLDFRTLEKRLHFCEEEVRLNRRLAPHVYLGVVPVVRNEKGLQFEVEGEVVEWAVKMQRLPDETTLLQRLGRGEVGVELVESLAQRIASFHRGAEANERIAVFGRFDAVTRIVLDIFAQAAAQVGITVSAGVFGRVQSLAKESLTRLRPLIEARSARGVPRDCHGDLHLDHVYYFTDQGPPADLVIIDCIEFNERFRFIDPVADMAFPAMDLAFHGRKDLARTFADAYFRATSDEEGRALLPLYTAYRATVRGMVEGLELAEKEVPEAERAAALKRARAHWLLAIGELETPGRRPCLVLIGGLPGTGKSTLAQALAKRANFHLIRSDLMRKELVGLSAQNSARSPFAGGIYAAVWTERTYAECLRRTEKLLFEGNRVIVDATFAEEKRRQAFLETAEGLAVPAIFFVCQANPEVVRRRLECRRGDASDADWSIYQKVSERWEGIGPNTQKVFRRIPTSGTKDQALLRALELLGESSLLD
jgi:aminoglycoside phosphotransferase family enzyme/predicted kinase